MKAPAKFVITKWVLALAALGMLMPWHAVYAQREESIKVSKGAIVSDRENFKKGEVVNIDNRSESDLTLGIQLPDKGLLYSGVFRQHYQTKVPREEWKRFALPPNSGVFVVVIPDYHRPQLETLDGAEIRIRIYQGDELREIQRIPIKVHADLLRDARK
ncbi:MAG: hypothetical protein ACOYXY_19600 [Thermodesulfobacteriota bacterium]